MTGSRTCVKFMIVRTEMNMKINTSQLRANIYKLLDRVLETGIPLKIERKGRTLTILPDEPPSRLSRLQRRDTFIKGDPADLVHMDWSGEWKP